MRISPQERSHIEEVVARFVSRIPQSLPVKLILFGSRVDDQARGGDIDLLLVVPQGVKSAWLGVRAEILASFKEGVGDQRIDWTVASPEQLDSEPFFQLALSKSLLLREYPSPDPQ